VNFRANGTAATHLEALHYYPFGMLMEGLGTINPTNDYAYNGKELNEDFGLGLTDYGARWYDAALGRWWGVDAKSEKYRSSSPYTYTLDNPIRYIDIMGMEVGENGDDKNKPLPANVEVTGPSRQEVREATDKALKAQAGVGTEALRKGISTDNLTDASLSNGSATAQGELNEEWGVDNSVQVSVDHEIKEGTLEFVETISTGDQVSTTTGAESSSETATTTGVEVGAEAGKSPVSGNAKGSYSNTSTTSGGTSNSVTKDKSSDSTKTYVYNATIVTTVTVTVTHQGPYDSMVKGTTTKTQSFETKSSIRSRNKLTTD
jgi:RHS repeat-associated protein